MSYAEIWLQPTVAVSVTLRAAPAVYKVYLYPVSMCVCECVCSNLLVSWNMKLLCYLLIKLHKLWARKRQREIEKVLTQHNTHGSTRHSHNPVVRHSRISFYDVPSCRVPVVLIVLVVIPRRVCEKWQQVAWRVVRLLLVLVVDRARRCRFTTNCAYQIYGIVYAS